MHRAKERHMILADFHHDERMRPVAREFRLKAYLKDRRLKRKAPRENMTVAENKAKFGGGSRGKYKPGFSCGRGNHKWVKHPTYLECKKCGSCRTLKTSMRKKVERL